MVLPTADKGLERRSTFYDPELLYVECARCGQPVVWDKGEATAFVAWSGVGAWSIDSTCLILTHGCPNCSPSDEAYRIQVVRGAESLGVAAY